MAKNLWRFCKFPSTNENADYYFGEVAEELRERGVSEGDNIFPLGVTLREALCNAVTHGNSKNPNKNVYFWYRIGEIFSGLDSGLELRCIVKDEGEGFDYRNIPDPTSEENREKSSGRGIYSLRHYSEWVKWNKRGNIIYFKVNFRI